MYLTLIMHRYHLIFSKKRETIASNQIYNGGLDGKKNK